MATATRQAAIRLDNAYECYAKDHGDSFSQPAWTEAYDLREDGYDLAEKAYALPADLRDAWVEAETDKHSESARHLVSCAVAFRLAELAAAEKVAA